jgi:hypothetical protein
MDKMKIRGILFLCIFCLLVAGCSKHTLEPEISLEDASKMLINDSALGVSIYGSNIVISDTVDAYYPDLSTDSIRWTAQWDFQPHSYPNSVYGDAVYWGEMMRTANMAIWDTAKVTLSIVLDSDSVVKKSCYTVAKAGAFLVLFGSYGSEYHGWVLRKIAHRQFNPSPTDFTPSLVSVVVKHAGDSWALTSGLFDLADRIRFARDDLITVRARTEDSTDVLFLNAGETGGISRIPMVFESQTAEHVASWRISSTAPTYRYYQAFVEVYSPSSFAELDSTMVGVAGQTFVYYIEPE